MMLASGSAARGSPRGLRHLVEGQVDEPAMLKRIPWLGDVDSRSGLAIACWRLQGAILAGGAPMPMRADGVRA